MKWEYLVKKIEEWNPVTHAAVLDALGRARWELVCVVNGVFLYFKRPKENGEPDGNNR